MLPPVNSGERISKELTAAAARKLAESAEYVALKKGGYKTFLTLTFDNAARARMSRQSSGGEFSKIHKWDKKYNGWELGRNYNDGMERTYKNSNIQKELKRFFDGLKKRVERGFYIHYRRKYNIKIYYPDGVADFVRLDFKREKIEGVADELCYLWVAENPPQKDKSGEMIIDRETGEFKRNPHVHVMLNYKTDWEIFPAFVVGLEKLWGQGFAHFEMIKNQKSAAAYLMKALGYITKAAAGSDQGIIYGNRYNISKNARAPGWVTVKNYAWHIAGQLIEKARMKQRRELRPLEEKREKIKAVIETATKDNQFKLKKALEKVRAKIEKTKGAIYYGRNRVICKGEESANRLLSWFKKSGWLGLDKPLSLYTDILIKKAERLRLECEKFYKYAYPPEWWDSLKFNNNLEPVRG